MVAEAKPSSTTPTPKPATGSSTAVKKKKKNAMIKIRGFLSGKSRRERRKEQESKKKSDNASKVSADDQSTVYNVNVDTGSVGISTPASLAAKKNLLDSDGVQEEADLLAENIKSGGKKYFLKVVLLLLDSGTRRFELLQLDFDSAQATVADVLAQIPISVTEEILKKQRYVGIADSEAIGRKPGDSLSDFCKGGDVLVATPEDMTPGECVKLALPILSDGKVIEMLQSTGVDASGWKDAKEKAKKALRREKEELLNKAKPSSGDKPITFEANKNLNGKSSKSSSFMKLLKLVAAVAMLTALFKVADSYLSRSIAPGQLLSPGTVLHKCGIRGLFPPLQSALSWVSSEFDCENASLHVQKDKVTGYDANGDVSWVIVATNQKNCDVDGEEACKLGLKVEETSHLSLSGSKITWVEVRVKGLKLDPWPFAEKPLVRTWRN